MSEPTRYLKVGYSKKYEDNWGAIFKKKRVVNEKLLVEYRSMFCEICGNKTNVCGHHIKSKGSGGPDLPHNLIPLCVKHHEEIHKKGINSFAEKYVEFKDFLESSGWEFFNKKWTHKDN